MKTNFMKHKRTLIASAILISFLLGTIVAQAATPSFTTYLMGGSLTETASYVVFVDGATYYAKNGVTSEVTSGSNISALSQSLVDAGASEIFYSAGEYTFPTHVLTEDSMLITGEGAGTILKNEVNDQIFRVIGKSNVTFRDLSFIGSNNVAHDVNVGITLINSTDIVIENVYGTEFGVHGISLFDCNDAVITKCNLFANQYANLYVGEIVGINSQNIIVSNNILKDSVLDNGVLFVHVNGGSITGNTINDNAELGVDLTHCENITVSGNSLQRNRFGIALNTPYSQFCSVSDNFVGDSSVTGILLIYGSNDTTISGNVVLGSADIGIDIGSYTEGYTARVLVIGNIVSDGVIGIRAQRIRNSSFVANSAHGNSVLQIQILLHEFCKINNNQGYVTENWGGVVKANGNTIAHGLSSTPVSVLVTSSVLTISVSVTAVAATTFTIGLWDMQFNTTYESPMTVYWHAKLIP